MVPTVRPSANTSILAPTRWGVEPCADTIVTSAASSPRSSASVSAVKTSCDMKLNYSRLKGLLLSITSIGAARSLRGLGPGQERLVDHARATGHGQQSRAAVDVGEADVRRHVERFVAVARKRAR